MLKRLIHFAVPPLAFLMLAWTTTACNPPVSPPPAIQLDTSGNAIDAHDGKILKFGDTYYWYGTSYGCGFEWQTPGTPFCGFKVYTSADLIAWDDQGFLFDASTPDWQKRCDGNTYGCFRPKVLYNASTKLYVLWINSYDVSVGYHVFQSPNPTGPFVEAALPNLFSNPESTGVVHGDFDLYQDDDQNAYIAFTDWVAKGNVVIEKLDHTFLTGTGEKASLGTEHTESPALFHLNNRYYISYSDPNCGYCTHTGTSYKVAASPLGPWTSTSSKLSVNSCNGQPAAVSEIPGSGGTQLLYQSDQWDNVNPNTKGFTANQSLAPYFTNFLQVNADGGLAPIQCKGLSKTSPTYYSVCDIGAKTNSGPGTRSQKLPATEGGILNSVSFIVFQEGNPTSALTASIVELDASNQVTENLFSIQIPVSQVSWAGHRMTLNPKIVLTAGHQYALVLSTISGQGCYGTAVSASDQMKIEL